MADTPISDPPSFARAPVVRGHGFDIPLSRPDRTFKWRQVDASSSDNRDQPSFALEHTQAFISAQGTSKWPEDRSTLFPTELTGADRHATQTQAWSRTQAQSQSQTQHDTYRDEITSALSSRAHPAKLSADMQRVLHNSDMVHSPQELQQRLESTGSPIMKYTDWYRPQELQHRLESTGSPAFKYSDWYRQGASPAATTASDEEEPGFDSLGAKLTSNGFGKYARAGAQVGGPLPAGRAVAGSAELSWPDQVLAAGIAGQSFHDRKQRQPGII